MILVHTTSLNHNRYGITRTIYTITPDSTGFADLTNKYLESEPGLLQEIAERVISGEVPMDEVLILLLEETDLELEQATQLNNELFDRVWSEKYDELNRQADNYSPINYMLKAGEEIESEPLNALKDLVAEFYNSPEVESVASSLKEHINNDDQDKTKEAFYGAINKKEKTGIHKQFGGAV